MADTPLNDTQRFLDELLRSIEETGSKLVHIGDSIVQHADQAAALRSQLWTQDPVSRSPFVLSAAVA